MVRKLFWEDAYVSSFQAMVDEISERNVYLDTNCLQSNVVAVLLETLDT